MSFLPSVHIAHGKNVANILPFFVVAVNMKCVQEYIAQDLPQHVPHLHIVYSQLCCIMFFFFFRGMPAKELP